MLEVPTLPASRVPATTHPTKEPFSERVTKPVPQSVLRVLKVVSALNARVKCPT
jgi:hypothetical protein